MFACVVRIIGHRERLRRLAATLPRVHLHIGPLDPANCPVIIRECSCEGGRVRNCFLQNNPMQSRKSRLSRSERAFSVFRGARRRGPGIQKTASR
jgi:hypothetical protein